MKILKLLSWICYYAGDLSSKILNIGSNSAIWCNIWYPIYNTLMMWSTEMQNYAGYDPHKNLNTKGWPWHKCEENLIDNKDE